METQIYLVLSFLVGATVGWLITKSKNASIAERLKHREEQLVEYKNLQQENQNLRDDVSTTKAKLEETEKSAREKLAILDDAQKKLADAFKALSSEALKSNNQSFLELAKTSLEKYQHQAKDDLETRQKSINELVKPLKESLEKVDVKIQELEKTRTSAYSTLTEQIKSLATTQTQLQSETANLVKALRAPQVRGSWGEIQLKRVCELAGMLEYCDFVEQKSVTDSGGNTLRPDMIINLPSNRQIIVDSKVPLMAFLEALQTDDVEQKINYLKDHARQIRTHVSKLSAKSYWDQFKNAPEFVVLFLPSENFLSAALEQDGQIIEIGVEQRVIIATPTTLIALLKAVSYGWRQEKMAENAEVISALGKELYERIKTFAGHFTDMKKGLERSVSSYNKAASSLETRVLVSARKFKELGATNGTDLENTEQIETTTRTLQVEEVLQIEDEVKEVSNS